MADERHIYISSAHNQSKFPHNKWNNFTNILAKPMRITRHTRVALSEYSFYYYDDDDTTTKKTPTTRATFVLILNSLEYSNLCGQMSPMLKCVHLNTTDTHLTRLDWMRFTTDIDVLNHVTVRLEQIMGFGEQRIHTPLECMLHLVLTETDGGAPVT